MQDVLNSVTGAAKCKEIADLTHTTLTKPTKDVLANLIVTMTGVLCSSKSMLKLASVKFEKLTLDQLENQKCLIKMQNELLQSKNDEVEAVNETVKTEMMSFSQALSQNRSKQITPKKLRAVVKSVVEDRKKNLMVFGLNEEDDEILDDEVEEMLQSMSYNPPVRESHRVGARKPGIDRPVKISFNSAEAAAEVLRLSRGLKKIPAYTTVFINPDRTPDERAARKKLVDILKQKITDDPEKYHFIRNGTVVSTDKLNKKKDENE